MKFKSITPEIALPGGVVRIEVEGLKDPAAARVAIGGVNADVMGASPSALTVRIPESSNGGGILVDGSEAPLRLNVGRVVATELHSVGNPVADSLGNVYVTYSGARGERVPFSVFVVYPDSSKHPFLADIVNPTGLAIGPDDCLYLSSRETGTLYRSTFDKQVDKYVDGLGLATGICFDSKGNLLVGDRSGMIYKITPNREISVFCELEPSVSAYHLAVDGDDVLYVSGPTLATQDSIYRVAPDGQVDVFFKGLGRPQGLQFAPDGKLEVVASYRGKKGLFSFQNRHPELIVAGPMLVGFTYFPPSGSLYLVDTTRLFRIDLRNAPGSEKPS